MTSHRETGANDVFSTIATASNYLQMSTSQRAGSPHLCWWEISLQHDRFRPHHQAPLGTVLLQHVKHLKFLAAVKDCMLALLLSNSQEHSLPITGFLNDSVSFFFFLVMMNEIEMCWKLGRMR